MIAASSLLDVIERCYDDLELMPLMYEACDYKKLI